MKLTLNDQEKYILSEIVKGVDRKIIAAALKVKTGTLNRIINETIIVNHLDNVYQLLYHYGCNNNKFEDAQLLDVSRFEVVDAELNERVFEITKCKISAVVKNAGITLRIIVNDLTKPAYKHVKMDAGNKKVLEKIYGDAANDKTATFQIKNKTK